MENQLENTGVETISTDGKTLELPEQPMEAESSTGKVKLPKKRRAAVCLDCSNEWMANNGNEKKPSRCPVCGSRRLKWKDEMPNSAPVETISTDDGRIEIPPENPVESSFSTGNPEPLSKPEKRVKSVPKPKARKRAETGGKITGKPGLENELTLEEAEKLVPKIPMQAIVFIVGGIALFAGICFLIGKGKRRISSSQKRNEETSAPLILPGIGGNFA